MEPAVRVCRVQPGAKLRRIKIAIESRHTITPKTIVNQFQERFFLATYAARYREDWQHATLVTHHAGVVAFAEFPASCKRDRPVAPIGSVEIFEIDVNDFFGSRDDGQDRNVAHGPWLARIADPELNPFLRNI